MKKKDEPQEIPIPEHLNQVPLTPSEAFPVITADEAKLEPINAIKAGIDKLKTDYGKLTISGTSDKAGFLAVSTARKDLKKKIKQVDDIRLGLNSDAQKYIKMVNKAAKSVSEELEKIKAPLELLESNYTIAIEKEKQAAEQERQLKVQQRAESLLKLNARFNGTHFTLGEVSISQSAIERISDEDFASELALMTQESEAILTKERAEKEAAAAEKLRLQQEAAKLKLGQDQLKKDREELEMLKAKLQATVVSEDPYKAIAAEAEEKITVVHEKPKISFEEMIANPVGGAKRAVEKTPEVIGEAISEPGISDADLLAFRSWYNHILGLVDELNFEDASIKDAIKEELHSTFYGEDDVFINFGE